MKSELALAIVAALTISMAVSFSTVTVSAVGTPVITRDLVPKGVVEATITFTPLATRDNAAILFTLTITNNDTQDNIENVELKAPAGSVENLPDWIGYENQVWNTFWGPIGGENVVENLGRIGDNMIAAAEYLPHVSASFGLAATNLAQASGLIKDAAGYLENQVAVRLQQAKLNDPDVDDNIGAAPGRLVTAAGHLWTAGDELGKTPINLVAVAENLKLFGYYENLAAGEIENRASINGLVWAGDAFENSAILIGTTLVRESAAQSVAENLRGGSFYGASGAGGIMTGAGSLRFGQGLENAARWLENAGRHLSLPGVGDNEDESTLIHEAGHYLDNYVARYLRLAAENLRCAGDNLRNAGENIRAIGNVYLIGLDRMMTTDPNFGGGTGPTAPTDNLLLTRSFIDNFIAAGDNLVRRDGIQGQFDNVLLAGDNLKRATDNQWIWRGPELASDIIGEVGEAATTTFRYYLSKVADNLRTAAAFDLSTAKDLITSAKGRLDAAGKKIKSTASAITPAKGWSLAVRPDFPERILLSATACENHIGPGSQKTFKFLWRVPDISIENNYTIWVFTYAPKGSAAGENASMGSRFFTVKVDGRPPYLVSFVVTQEGVADNNVVGTIKDNGRVTITLTASEPLATLGENKAYIENRTAGVNLVDPVTMTADATKTVWTGTFNVLAAQENWENAWVRIPAPWATDNHGLENEENAYDNFLVDVYPPLFIDNGLRTTFDALPACPKPGTPYSYKVTTRKTWTVTVHAEDDQKRGAAGQSPENRQWCTVVIELNGENIATTPTAEQKYQKTLTLAEGLNTIKVFATDRVGNATENKIENIFVDNIRPTVTFVGITDVTGVYKSWTDNTLRINDNTPKIKLTIVDPGYPTTGWGCVGADNENVRVFLDDDENLFNLPAPIVLENLGPWDNGETGTFENLYENYVGTTLVGMPEGWWYILVSVSDNLHDNENYVQRFYIDVTKPIVPAPTAAENPLAGTSVTAPRIRKSTTLILTGSGAEEGATVKVYLNDSLTAHTSAIVDAYGRWSVTITLTAGQTTKVEVTLTDTAGNESTRYLYGYVMADGTAPTVSIETAPASTDKASVMICGTISKDAWETYAEITVVVSPTTATLSYNEENGGFTVSAPLSEGLNLIAVSATDGANNTGIGSVSIERTVTAWATYAIIIVIVALVLAAIAIFRKR